MPPDRFEVDLTSVCVRRGAVQLPFRLKDAFSEGPVAAVDADSGAALELGFRAPRELMGLAPFFEAHALRANDRIVLVFTHESLQVQAIRRERSGARRTPEREAAGGTVAGGRARPAPPAKGSPGGTPEASGPASSPSAGDDSAPRSAASQTPPSLRLEVPRTSVPASEGLAPGAAQAPRWQPLDVTAETPRAAQGEEPSGRERAPGDGGPDGGGTGSVFVREVRRGAPQPAAEQAKEQPADVRPHPARAAIDKEGAGQAGVERRDTAERGNGAPSGLLGLLGLGRGSGRPPGRREGRNGEALRPRGQAPSGDRSAGDRARPDRPGTGDPSVRDPAGDEAREEGPGAARDLVAESHGQAGDPPADAVASEPVGALQSEPTLTVDEPSWEPDAVSRDMGAVRRYLAGPDVPAIVRTERVAETLELSVARAERALERVSEESEHLSRIRSGAYMLRRPSKE